MTGRLAFAMGLALHLATFAGATARAGDDAASPPVPGPVAPTQAGIAPRPLPHERTISLKHHWTREELTIVYRIGDGYVADALAKINWLLRDYRCNQSTVMDPKLIDLVFELQHELQPKGPIRVVSAYRSEGHNASLLRAGRTVDPDSQHTQGRAMDVIFPGVPAERLRAAGEAHGVGGVGYYPFSGPVFVHIDTGPVRHWTERDPKENRALGLARRRGRLALDCTLTTEKALEQVSAEQAYAALPPGAASKPRPAMDVAGGTVSDGAAPMPPSVPGQETAIAAGAPSAPDADGPACIGAMPLPSLSLLPRPPERLAARAVARARALSANRQKQKVKAQVMVARGTAAKRGKPAKSKPSPASKASRKAADGSAAWNTAAP